MPLWLRSWLQDLHLSEYSPRSDLTREQNRGRKLESIRTPFDVREPTKISCRRTKTFSGYRDGAWQEQSGDVLGERFWERRLEVSMAAFRETASSVRTDSYEQKQNLDYKWVYFCHINSRYPSSCPQMQSDNNSVAIYCWELKPPCKILGKLKKLRASFHHFSSKVLRIVSAQQQKVYMVLTGVVYLVSGEQNWAQKQTAVPHRISINALHRALQDTACPFARIFERLQGWAVSGWHFGLKVCLRNGEEPWGRCLTKILTWWANSLN